MRVHVCPTVCGCVCFSPWQLCNWSSERYTYTLRIMLADQAVHSAHHAVPRDLTYDSAASRVRMSGMEAGEVGVTSAPIQLTARHEHVVDSAAHTHVHTHTQSVNQLVISLAVLMVRGVSLFPTALEVIPGHPIAFCNLCSRLHTTSTPL